MKIQCFSGLVMALALLLPFGFGLATHSLLEQWLGSRFWWVPILVFAQVIILGVLTVTQKRLPQEPSQRLNDTARKFLRIRRVDRLLKLTTRLLVRHLGAGHVLIYQHVPGGKTFQLVASHGSMTPTRVSQLDMTSPAIQWLTTYRQPLCSGALDNGLPKLIDGTRQYDPAHRIRLVMDNLKADLIIPSFEGQNLFGFIVLGPRPNNQPFTSEEVDALSRLAQDCAVALDNARDYERLVLSTEKLESAQERLVRQERMVAAGRLAMGLAHEVKNPLAAIKTFSELLPARYEDPAFRAEFAQVVGAEIDRISQIVQSLSDFSKPILLKLETLDIQRLLRQLLTFLNNDCLKRRVTVEQHFEADSIFLPGDPNQLKQAFLNLCVNALEAMPSGGSLMVSCALYSGEAVIRIGDTGCGIAQERLSQLFVPFFTTKDNGMGLGLSVVKQIVSQHAGTIKVESTVGRGTTFTICLPLAVRVVPKSLSAASEQHAPTDGHPEMDLLVIDDEPKICSTIRAYGEARGAQVRVVASGEEALRAIGQRPPQITLLDLTLEAMDGFEVLKRVKLIYPTLPVVVITGSDEADVEQRVHDLGALACLHKPLDLPTLYRHLTELMEQHASSQQQR